MLIFCHVDKNIDDELLDAAYKLSLDERRSKADKLINPQKKEISLAAGMLERLMQEKYKYKFQNLSHSDEYAVCIGEDRLCGVDIQKICNVSENLKKRVCTPKELEAIENAPNPDLRFIQYWALKEA
ncbi:MAG: 4'-phosphopantetheinyl transferase superfamily protein, partial [Oscillospiraceae bacterium]